MEKEVLGFYLTSHPLAEHEKTLRTFCSHSSTGVGELEHRTEVVMGGQIAPKNLFDLRPDLRTLKMLSKVKERNAETLFGAIANELEVDGISLTEIVV